MKSAVWCLFFLLVPSVYNSAENIWVCHVVVPNYPRLARMARLQGSVSVEIEIGADGRVISAKASGASKLLQRESEDNIRLWTFRPSPTSGGVAPSRIRITYVFKLEGKGEYYDPPPSVTLDLPYRVEIISRPPEPQPVMTKAVQ